VVPVLGAGPVALTGHLLADRHLNVEIARAFAEGQGRLGN
jgi:hypothetical protein